MPLDFEQSEDTRQFDQTEEEFKPSFDEIPSLSFTDLEEILDQI